MNIDNNIQDSYCSFAVSKLLKELGFDCLCDSSYELALTSKKDKQDGYSGPFGWKKGEFNISHYSNLNSSFADNKNWYSCSRPTHSLAIKWIRENFKKNIYTNNDFEKWIWSCYNIPEGWFIKSTNCEKKEYESPEDATEAGLLYILNKIKNEN